MKENKNFWAIVLNNKNHTGVFIKWSEKDSSDKNNFNTHIF